MQDFVHQQYIAMVMLHGHKLSVRLIIVHAITNKDAAILRKHLYDQTVRPPQPQNYKHTDLLQAYRSNSQSARRS